MQSICEMGETYLWFAVMGHFLLYILATVVGTLLAFRAQDWWDGV